MEGGLKRRGVTGRGFDRGQDEVFVLLGRLQRGEPRGGGFGKGLEEGGGVGGCRMEFMLIIP